MSREMSDKERKVAAQLDLFEERMYAAIFHAKCKLRPCSEIYNIIADGIAPFPGRFRFTGIGVNEIIMRAARVIGAEDEAEKLLDKVDNILELLDERGNKRATKKIIAELEKIRQEVYDFFKNKGYKPFKEPTPINC